VTICPSPNTTSRCETGGSGASSFAYPGGGVYRRSRVQKRQAVYCGRGERVRHEEDDTQVRN
jgi:hypothetical protein